LAFADLLGFDAFVCFFAAATFAFVWIFVVAAGFAVVRGTYPRTLTTDPPVFVTVIAEVAVAVAPPESRTVTLIV
jgi:hypothetical protein